MRGSKKSVESTPNVNLMARVSLAWTRPDDSLGKDCYFEHETENGVEKEFIEVWLPESPFQTPGTFQLHSEEFDSLQNSYRRVAEGNPRTLKAMAARQIVADLGLLRWRVANKKSTFVGRTGIRLVVFASKA